jgi:hypothetical protein
VPRMASQGILTTAAWAEFPEQPLLISSCMGSFAQDDRELEFRK